MKLNDFLCQRKISKRKFAKLIGLSHATICYICQGKRCFLRTAQKIERATEGLVTVAELLAGEKWIQMVRYH